MWGLWGGHLEVRESVKGLDTWRTLWGLFLGTKGFFLEGYSTSQMGNREIRVSGQAWLSSYHILGCGCRLESCGELWHLL